MALTAKTSSMESTYVEAHHQNVWIRIAGHSRRIRERDRFQWRYVLEGSDQQFPLAAWEIIGTASLQNFRPGTNPAAQGEEQLLAWIDLFGDLSVGATGHAKVILKKPALSPKF